ncbi:vacuolar protein-sorting-associated protein 36-like [Limulus polyphemus]|uniref:Vacuolar protein-sorting-associated protein 36 n=1 Tax=Limulus polyphemus TaxID=6850 RepID=A0ABM1BAS4_LIMPO|nr:vacuolar protein-sorting-associated protein 36-like [Limulus polyphemus]
MDRFEWCDGSFQSSEKLLFKIQSGVKLYDGDNVTNFVNGGLTLTNYRILWQSEVSSREYISLQLQLVVFIEKESSGWGRSGKIVVHLIEPSSRKGQTNKGPVQHSPFSFVKFTFKNGGEIDFYTQLNSAIEKREWEQKLLLGKSERKLRTGIVGIERQIQEKQKETDKSISAAFKDLSKLMDMAKDMVSLSKTIAQKIQDQKGEISEDETIRFKSYLLSLGVSDPVTKDTHGTGDDYHKELAKELANLMEKPIEEAGGIMPLSDIYCRVNRARGLELLSPEDLVNACKVMEILKLPVKLHIFDSGVMVLKLSSQDDSILAQSASVLVEEKESLTSDELSRILGTSVVLAKERLLSAEKSGFICRDDSVEGLRFYKNRFLKEMS